MNSKHEQIYPENIIENFDNNYQKNSNKKFFYRNQNEEDNCFNNSDYIENHYISKSFNNIDKNQKEDKLKEEYNPKIKNQFNNKKFTNNIINYCLINPNHNQNIQNQANNFFYNLDNDVLFNEHENPFPKPEPTPIKIDKSTKYINISKSININNKSSDNVRNIIDIRLMAFLHNLNLDYLDNIFKNNYINFKDLFLLTKDDLIEMKIPIGPRNKLIHYIELYKKSMKNYELEDILYFFRHNKEQNFVKKSSSTTPSTYINDFSKKIKVNENPIFFNYSESKRGNNINNENENINDNIETVNNKTDYSFIINNNSDKYTKTSIDKSITEIEKKNNFNVYNLKMNYSYMSDNNRKNRNKSIIESKKMKIPSKKKNYNNNSFIFQYNYIRGKQKNKVKKNNNNKNCLNIKTFNKKHLKNSYNFYYRNSMSNFIQNISSIKPNSKIYDQNKNLKTTKPKNYFNDSYLNNQSKNIINKKSKNIKRSKSIKMPEKKENNLLENFRSLNTEVEKFEIKYKKMKLESCERKKKIKTLLTTNKSSTGKIKLLKQQLNNINKINPQYNESLCFIDKNKLNNMNIIVKKSDQETKNISINKDKNNKTTNNLLKKNEKILFYKLNIDNI